jgi:hypothetical protein
VGLPSTGWSQAGVTVTGVVENEAGTLMPDVKFTLLSASASDLRETVTDKLGRFSFRNISPGPYVLGARARGYEPAVVAVAVGTEPLVSLKITVKRTHDGESSSAGPPEAAASPPPPESDPAGTKGQTPELPNTTLPRLWSFAATVANVYENNIDHDDQGVNAYGFVYGTGVHYQTSRDRPLFQLDYGLARYTYPGADRWSRLSHNLRTSLEKRLTRRLSVEALGEVTPRLDLRLPRDHRVRLYAAHRLKRYGSNTGRNATNRYVGLELRQRLDSGDTWEIGYRYEQNDAVMPRYRYLRLTYETGYSTLLTSRDTVSLNVKYRSQRYRERLVEVDDIDVPRHDQQWVPSVSWRHRFGTRVELTFEYRLDTQSSNDLDRDYSAHSTGLSFRTLW